MGFRGIIKLEMGHSKLFLFILIASALLLSAANESAEEKAVQKSLTPPKTEMHKSKAEEHSSTGTQKAQDTEKSPPATKPPIVVVAVPSDKTQTKTTEEQQSTIQKWFNPSTLPNWAIVLVTIAYVIVAIGQLTAIRRQAKFARRSLRAINRQAGIAAEGVAVNRIAAEAAKTTATIADQSLKSLERAYLAIFFESPVSLVWSTWSDLPYTIENTGRTLAKLKLTEIGYTISESLHDYEIKPVPTDKLPTIAPIYAATPLKHTFRIPRLLTTEEVGGLTTGSKILDLHGFIIYDDIFDIRHVTRFRRVWSPSENGGQGGFVFPPETKPEYNEAD